MREGEPRLLGPGHHGDLRGGLVADPGQDLLAVLGLPDRRGRERDEVLYALVLRDSQRLEAVCNRLIGHMMERARREGVEHNVVNANPYDFAFMEIEHLKL